MTTCEDTKKASIDDLCVLIFALDIGFTLSPTHWMNTNLTVGISSTRSVYSKHNVMINGNSRNTSGLQTDHTQEAVSNTVVRQLWLQTWQSIIARLEENQWFLYITILVGCYTPTRTWDYHCSQNSVLIIAFSRANIPVMLPMNSNSATQFLLIWLIN